MDREDGRKRRVCILKSSQNDGLWGLAVDPRLRRSLFRTDCLGLDSDRTEDELLETMRREGFESLNAFILHAIRQGLVRLVEPCGTEDGSGAFILPKKPDFLWSIEKERLVPAGQQRCSFYFVCRGNGGERYIRAPYKPPRCYSYDPSKLKGDGGFLWYGIDGGRNVVFKKFDGDTYANVVDDAGLRELLRTEKSGI